MNSQVGIPGWTLSGIPGGIVRGMLGAEEFPKEYLKKCPGGIPRGISVEFPRWIPGRIPRREKFLEDLPARNIKF